MHSRFGLLIIIFFASSLAGINRGLAQSLNLTKINGQPSSEAYDVLMDKKGFIWVGHSLGLSRYDGHTFTNFSSPDQISLSTSGLLEDAHGRIWCQNFSGQIFYVEHEKMHLLKSYNASIEHNFPRMSFIGNYLIATSDRGLFLYNTQTRKHRYIPCITSKGKPSTTASLACLNNQIIAYGLGEWFKCDTNGRVTTLKKHPSVNLINNNSYLLQPFTYHDTIYVISYISGLIHKLGVDHDTIRVTGKVKLQSFINTLSLSKNQLWINTKKESININTGQKIGDYNISDITPGAMGDTWYSSLKFGLLVNSPTPRWQYSSPELDKGDYIRCISRIKDQILYGTQNGHLIQVAAGSQKVVHQITLPPNSGVVEVIKPCNNQFYLIGASVGVYLYELSTHKLIQLSSAFVIKDALITPNQVYLALSNDLMAVPTAQIHKPNALALGHTVLPKHQRSRALAYDTVSGTLYGAFKNDLLKIKDGAISRVLLDNRSIYASALVTKNQKVLVGTYTQGLLLIKPSGIKRYDASNGLLSSTISRIFLSGHHAWVVGNSCLQLFDMDKEKLIKKINFPSSANIGTYDIMDDGKQLYVSTSNGLAHINYVASANTFPIKNYLLYSIVNNHDTVFTHSATLPYLKNNISFALDAVSYDNADEVYFKYKLDGSNNNKWQRLPAGVKSVQFASLMPGQYRFRAAAQHALGRLTSPEIIFDLTIEKPWWQQWWFIGLCLLTLVLLTVAIFKIYYKVIIDKQKLRYEKILAIEYERQTISRELHDNIGQLLSLVKLTLGTTAGQSEQQKQQKIEESRELVGQAITDLRNISKSLSFHNISHVGLTKAIKKEAERINRSGLLNMTVNVEGTPYSLGEQNELVIFRIFQEALNNTLKHADAENLVITLLFNTESLNLTIADDGKGFMRTDKLVESGSGLKNMDNRATLLGADLQINTAPGKGCQISLTLDTLTP